MFQRAQLEVYGDTVCAVPVYGDAYDAQHKDIEDIFQEVFSSIFSKLTFQKLKRLIKKIKYPVGLHVKV